MSSAALFHAAHLGDTERVINKLEKDGVVVLETGAELDRLLREKFKNVVAMGSM